MVELVYDAWRETFDLNLDGRKRATGDGESRPWSSAAS